MVTDIEEKVLNPETILSNASLKQQNSPIKSSKINLISSKLKQILIKHPIIILVMVYVVLVFAKLLLVFMLNFMEENYTHIELEISLGYKWDSIHFVNIAKDGYPKGVTNDIKFAFAPLYPLLIRLGFLLFENYSISGIVISNFFYFISILFFFQVSRIYTDLKESALLTLLFGVFPPYLVYGTLAYTEPVYIAFAIGSWYFFKKEKYFLTALFTTGAILTRYIGGFLLVIYGIIILGKIIKAWKSSNSLIKSIKWQIIWFGIPIIGLLSLFYYFYLITGDFFIVNSSHVYFDDSLTNPITQFNWFFDGFFVQINNGVNPLFLAIERYLFTIPFFILIILNFKDEKELGLYGIIFMGITISMSGITALASPRIMLGAWVGIFGFKKRIQPGIYFVLIFFFIISGCWLMYKYQTSFFA